MYKTLFVSLFVWVTAIHSLIGLVIKTNEIEEINSEITENTFVLFNIAEVLLDSKISLGTQAWRKYVRARLTPQEHDALTLFVFKHVPPKLVEEAVSNIISSLQERDIPVFAFTSRGRNQWYSSSIVGIDSLTENVLKEVGIDFYNTLLPNELTLLDQIFDDYFHRGIIYGTNDLEKGEVLEMLLLKTGYRPERILFVDDKIGSVESVEKKLETLAIPFVGYAYSRTTLEHANFDPMIAHIQLDYLLSNGQILSDDQAYKIKIEQYSDINADDYFSQVIEKFHQKTSSQPL